MNNPRKTVLILLILLLCAGLLCPASSFASNVSAGSTYSDVEEIYAGSILVDEGCRSVSLGLKEKYPDLEFTNYTDQGETAISVDGNGIVTILTAKFRRIRQFRIG